MKFYIEKRKNKKNEREYLALICEKANHYPIIVTYDALTIYKLTGKKKNDLKPGEKIDII